MTSSAAPVALTDLKYDARPNPPVNLLQNGDLEGGSGAAPSGWRTEATPAGATLTWNTAQVVSGAHALLVTTTAAGRAAWTQDVGSVEAGLRYRLRAYVLASTAAQGSHALEIFWLDGNGATVGHDALQSTTAGAWFEADGFVTAPQGSAKARVAVAALTPGQYSFDDVMFVTAEPEPIAIGGGFPLGFWSMPARGAVKNPDFRRQGAPGQPLAWQRAITSGDASLGWTEDGTFYNPGTLDIRVFSSADAVWLQNVDIDPNLRYELRASILASTTAPGSHAVEVIWRDAAGRALGQATLSATSANVWSDLSTGALQPPAQTVSATVRFRASIVGTYQARLLNLFAAGGTSLFAPEAVGFNFGIDSTGGIPRYDESFLTFYGSQDVTVGSVQSRRIWLSADEPAWTSFRPASALTTSYTSIKQANGPIPVWINQAPRGPISDPGNYPALLPWSSAADVFSIDVYPIPPLGHAALPNEGPWSVGDYTDILRRDLVTWNGAQRKAVWMVLQGFPWWEEEFKGGADHAVVVEWRDAGGHVLRTDGVGADRLNMARDVAIDGMSPPPGATVAALKVAAYRPGDYSFSTATLAEQGGQPLLASGGSPIAFPLDRARGEELVGTTPVQPGRRYTVTARIVAASRPSYEQTRFMAWNAIVHGARGLSWFGFQYVPEGDTFLRDIGRVATELKTISKDLLSPVSLRSVRVSDSAIEAALFRGSDGLFLAVTNRGRASVDATISIDGPITSITTADAEACAPLVGNAFRAQLEGLAVHLYRIR